MTPTYYSDHDAAVCDITQAASKLESLASSLHDIGNDTLAGKLDVIASLLIDTRSLVHSAQTAQENRLKSEVAKAWRLANTAGAYRTLLTEALDYVEEEARVIDTLGTSPRTSSARELADRIKEALGI